MTKKITQIVLTTAVLFLLISCQDTKQKIQAFVNNYNASAALYKDETVTGTSAKAFLNDNKVEITIETNIEDKETSKIMYERIFAEVMAERISKEKASTELIEEGVTFEVLFLANTGTTLGHVKIDKKDIDAFLKKDFVDQVTAAKPENSNINPELQQFLEIMNKNLPLKNADGSTILKFEANEKKELILKVEVSKENAAIVKTEGYKVILKENVLRSKGLKSIVSMMALYDISTVKYQYQDAAGKELNTVVLTDKDLK